MLKGCVALPGFERRRRRIFVELLGKHIGVGRGWGRRPAQFGAEGVATLSVADIYAPSRWAGALVQGGAKAALQSP